MRRSWPLGLFLSFAVSQDIDVAATTSPAVCAAEKTAAHKKVVCTPIVGVDKSPGQACNTWFSSTTGCDATPGSTTFPLALPSLTARCGPESCVSCKKAGAKRDVEANLSEAKPVAHLPYHRLEARAPKAPKDYAGDFDKFMVGEVEKAADDGVLVPLRRGDRVGTSARVKPFGREPFNAAVKNMKGCTSIGVTSRRGVWLSHIWEDPSMNKGGRDGEDRFHGRDVLTGIFTGDSTPNFPGLTEFTNDRSYFNHESYGGIPNKVQPIIYSPRRRPEHKTEEGKKAIKDGIEDFGGAGRITQIGLDPESDEAPSYLFEVAQIMEHMSWHFKMFIKVHTYIQLDVLDPFVQYMDDDYEEKILETTAHGKVLVQYDPGHCPNAGEPPNKAQVNVYMTGSTEPIYHDEWDAMPDQLPVPAAQGAAQKPLIAIRDEYNRGYVCVHHNTTTSSTSTSDSTSATLPAITSCSPLTSGNQANPEQTQCACNDDLIAVLSSSTQSDGAAAFWCGAGEATVSVNAPTPKVTSCTPKATTWAGHSNTTLCECNGGQTLTASSTTGKDAATTVFCADSQTTVPARTIPAAAGASVMASILGGIEHSTSSWDADAGASAMASILGTLKPEPTTTVSFSPPLDISQPEQLPPPVVVVVTSTKKPEPTPKAKPKAFTGGQCAIHVRRTIRGKEWPEGPNIGIAYLVYDGSDKLMHEGGQRGEFNKPFIIKQWDTKLDHDIEIRYDKTDQTCPWNMEQPEQHKYDWAIQCRYQNFSYGSDHWRVSNGPENPKDPVRPYCRVGKWDTATREHTQDMDCFFTC